MDPSFVAIIMGVTLLLSGGGVIVGYWLGGRFARDQMMINEKLLQDLMQMYDQSRASNPVNTPDELDEWMYG